MNTEELGRIAYDAYCEARGWKSVRGEPLPHFQQQDEGLRQAWIKSAEAVATVIRNHTAPG